MDNNNIDEVFINMFCDMFYKHNNVNFNILLDKYADYIRENNINRKTAFDSILAISINLDKKEYKDYIKSIKKHSFIDNKMFKLFPSIYISLIMLKRRNMRFFKSKYYMLCWTRYILKKIIFKFNPKLNVNYVEFVITTKCTLNCKDCANLMQLYKKPYNVDNDILKKSIINFFKSVNSVKKVRIIGGEPLCNKNIKEYLKLIDYKKSKKVDIVTNGTIDIKDKELLDLIKKNNVIIEISDYGNLSKNRNNLINTLNENNISFKLKTLDNYWIDFGYPKNYCKSKKQLRKQFTLCDSICKSVLNGCLYYCPRESHGNDLKLFKVNEDEYVDLINNDTNTIRKKLRKMYYRSKPITACNYCLYKTGMDRKIIPAIQK